MWDPKTGELVGIDADLSEELGMQFEYVDTSFGIFMRGPGGRHRQAVMIVPQMVV
jgi:hypothetical protein